MTSSERLAEQIAEMPKETDEERQAIFDLIDNWTFSEFNRNHQEEQTLSQDSPKLLGAI